MLVFTPEAAAFTPNAITKYPKATKANPIAIFMGDEGSRLPSLSQRRENMGAKIKMAKGVTD